ncbi:MAG: histidine phosphatase family protein [Planctomycetaceae bacterium]|nr:histidine phosphatase family protein [Planctomycetaceae bacterium]
MKTLLLLRHAKSDWSDSSLADVDRPLNRRGRRAAARMGRLLQSESLLPDLLVSSPAVRARKTAVRVARRCGYERAIELQPDLYHAAPGGICRVLRSLWSDPACVLLVGHNPGLEELLERLTGQYERFPTAALAQLALPIESWDDLEVSSSATLLNLWRPRQLD